MKLKKALREIDKPYVRDILNNGNTKRTYAITKDPNQKWDLKKVKIASGWIDYLGGKMPKLNNRESRIVVTSYID